MLIIHLRRGQYFNKDQIQKTKFSFENGNQPVCSSASSCFTLNASSIFMSSFSSLINAIFIIVCHVVASLGVFPVRSSIINRNTNKSKLNLSKSSLVQRAVDCQRVS